MPEANVYSGQGPLLPANRKWAQKAHGRPLPRKQTYVWQGGALMRIQGRLKLGYYPLPESEAQRIGRFVRFPAEQCQALDPCSGTGAALKALTDDINSGLITEVYMQGRSMLPDTIDNMYGFSALVRENDIKISFLNYGD